MMNILFQMEIHKCWPKQLQYASRILQEAWFEIYVMEGFQTVTRKTGYVNQCIKNRWHVETKRIDKKLWKSFKHKTSIV